jgi:AcrR family transcriptional regulator
MPPRPSRNLDRALLAAGRALLPLRGCAGLTIREVAEAAGVNLGMFHYHFKSREAFLRALLQSLYEDMYAQLTFEADEKLGPVEALRSAMRFMTRFVRGNRAILSRVLADALTGDAIAREFLRNNFPRHIGVIHLLIHAGQEQGLFKPMPIPQAMGFCIGSLAMPILFGGAVVESGTLGPAASKTLTEAVLSDAALEQRIEMALGAISVSTAGTAAKPAARARKPRGKS